MSAKSKTKTGPGDRRRAGYIKRVWGIAKDLGLDDDTLYLIIFQVTGSDSLSALFKPENLYRGLKLITHLETMQRNRDRTARRNGVVSIQGYRKSDNQIELIKELAAKINGDRPKIDLESMSRRMYKKPVEKLNRRQAQGMIEALKSINQRK